VRAPSASSDYSDIVTKPKIDQTASGSVKSLHEMFEGMSKSSVKEEHVEEKKRESSSSSESEEDDEDEKKADPRIPSASSDYSDIVEKDPKKRLVHESSSEYENEGEKRGLQPTQQKSFSSDYSDIPEKRQEERIGEAGRLFRFRERGRVCETSATSLLGCRRQPKRSPGSTNILRLLRCGREQGPSNEEVLRNSSKGVVVRIL